MSQLVVEINSSESFLDIGSYGDATKSNLVTIETFCVEINFLYFP